MRTLLLLVVLLTLGCTARQPMQELDISRYAHCQDADCVVDAIDAAPPEEKACEHPLWMEGYQMRPLRWLIEDRRLELVEWNTNLVGIAAAVLPAVPYGGSVVRRGVYGDFHSATVYYTNDPGWHILAHELMHVAGPCPDLDLFGHIENAAFGFFWTEYTDEQELIMRQEGVDRWVDTSFYKEERIRDKDTRLFDPKFE